MIHFSAAQKRFGSKVLFQDASFQLNPGEKVGLVGSNGSGKTTLFRLISGEESLDAGAITKAERTVVGYFSQDIAEMSGPIRSAPCRATT
jgi:ATP-binding cassette subfamily F protein 3